jgi:hypothetical protein
MRIIATLAAATLLTAGIVAGAQAQSSNDAGTSRAPGSAVTTPSATNGMSNGSNSMSNGTNGMSNQSGTSGGATNGTAPMGPNGTPAVPADQSRVGTGRGQ